MKREGVNVMNSKRLERVLMIMNAVKTIFEWIAQLCMLYYGKLLVLVPTNNRVMPKSSL